MPLIGQWTTPTTTFYVKDALFTNANSIVVSFKQKEYLVEKTDATVVDDEHIAVTLTQTETGKFIPGLVQAQINWKNSGKRAMTRVVTFTVEDNLKDEVL